MTHDQAVRVAAAGLGGWDVVFCPVCDEMCVEDEANEHQSLEAHLRRSEDGAHKVAWVMLA